MTNESRRFFGSYDAGPTAAAHSFFKDEGSEIRDAADVFALSTWPKTHVDTSIRITRGATRQMLFIGSGERLDSALHSREAICSLEITHQADGKVSVISRDTPFNCAIAFEKSGDRYNSFRSYTTYTSLTANKRQNLLAMQRTNGVWVLTFVGRNYRLEITPGETLVVTHKAG